MAEMGVGRSTEGGAVAFSNDAQPDVSTIVVTASSYCGECGSWGAHGARCVCCGYDFHADPIDTAALD